MREEPRLIYLGHAGFAFISGRTTLLMDPWLSGTGAFLRTWFPYPDNTHLGHQLLSHCSGCDLYVYISHLHEDHCDTNFLRELERFNPTYILPGFADDAQRRVLDPIKGRKIFLGNGESTKVGDSIEARIFIDESGINTDSAILARSAGRTFLNLNDCKIFDRLPAIIKEPVHVFSCQFSGATWHPTCYQYDEATYRRISIKKKTSKFFRVYTAIKNLGPEIYIPSAGPAVLLHPALYEKNFEPVNIFPRANEFCRYLENRPLDTRVQMLKPGEELALGSGEVKEVFGGAPSADLDTYRQSKMFLYKEPKSYDPDALLDALFGEIQMKLVKFQTTQTTKFDILLGIAGTERKIRINLNGRTAELVRSPAQAGPLYTLEASPEAVSALVNHTIEPENFCLSFLFHIRRDPDEYCPLVNLFFFCSTDNLRESLRRLESFRSSSGRIEIATATGRFICRRLCPHQGADLEYGHAEGNMWVCPRHGWRFDLEKGGLSEDGSCSIQAERVVW
jgi:UDP-MurNAc hydroxylase